MDDLDVHVEDLSDFFWRNPIVGVPPDVESMGELGLDALFLPKKAFELRIVVLNQRSLLL